MIVLGVGCGGNGGKAATSAAVRSCFEQAGAKTDAPLPDSASEQGKRLADCLKSAGTSYDEMNARLREAVSGSDSNLLGIVRCMRDKGWEIPDPPRGQAGQLILGDLDQYYRAGQGGAFYDDFSVCSGTDRSQLPAGDVVSVGAGHGTKP